MEWFGIGILEWVGYLASLLVLISLLMSSIIKLRWINLTGSAIFALYGFLIGAYPVGISNVIIMLINVYYLWKIYSAKDYFQILPIQKDSEYLDYFLDFYKKEILRFFPDYNVNTMEHPTGLFLIRNCVPAGIFMASEEGADSLLIYLDFVSPEYRDFKIGKYLFEERKDYFLSHGIKYLYSYGQTKPHSQYLIRMGFVKTSRDGREIYQKTL